ncbi:MAG: DUF4038 domain-containing protein [Spirochaetaceae bacterium]|nr:MAG: DUF4038 domain-containing protein [Spirochaetaceae bacterium]
MKVRIDESGHFFETEDGTPFFYLADTAWMLFNKLTEEEVREYFADRSTKGFTVIQSCVFRDLFEPNTPNVYGERPFADDMRMKAAQMNPRWIDYVKRVLSIAEEFGLVLALLPTWGDKWNERNNSAGPVIFDERTAEVYGRDLSDALGEYRNVIWVLGGDSAIQTQAHANIIRAMAHGLRSGAGSDRLITFHPGGSRSSAIFHGEAWLDINTMQSGHQRLNVPNYQWVHQFYSTPPAKPCLDIEPNYEWAPVGWGRVCNPIEPEHRAYFDDYDVRRSLYRSVLAGAAGFTYGCEPIRQVYRSGDRSHAWDGQGIRTWQEGLAAPGSSQLQLVKRLLLERSYFTRIPASELLHEPAGGGSDPVSYVAAARCSAGSYIMVYIPIRQMLAIDTSVLPAKRLRISVYDPEACVCRQTFDIDNEGIFRYVPPRRLDTLITIDAAGERSHESS